MNTSVRNKPLRVAFFAPFCPFYRKGIFERLNCSQGIELTVHTDSRFPIGLPVIDPADVSFLVKESRAVRVAIRWAKIELIFQPVLPWHVLAGTYDAYLLPSGVSSPDVWIAAILGRLLGRPICFWGHGRSRRPGAVSAALRNMLTRLPHTNVFYTPGGRERWVRAGFRKETLYVAPNALNTEESACIRKSIDLGELEEFKRVNGLAGKRAIIFAGRLQPRKRPELLIRAFAEVVPRASDAHLIVIGGGPLLPALAALVTQLDLNDHVSLTGEVYDQKHMGLYMMSSSIAAMPAAAGLFIQHAFDYGLPIVIGDDMIQHGPEADLVVHGSTGLFFSDGDVQQFASAMMSLLDNEALRLLMGRTARKLIENTYHLQNMADGLAEAIRGAARVCHSRDGIVPTWLRRFVHTAWTAISTGSTFKHEE